MYLKNGLAGIGVVLQNGLQRDRGLYYEVDIYWCGS